MDALVILLVGLATWLSWPDLDTLALLFPITLFHFFLFCNVFRVRRTLELTWAAVFLANITIWSLVGHFNWWWILAAQLPVTLTVIAFEIRSPRYHGILYRLKQPR